jgi:hypothetical protein
MSKEEAVRPVPLSVFLQTLLGKDLGVSGPEQAVLREGLLKDASDVWINFTHFVQLPVPIDEVSPYLLVKAWSPGVAYHCVYQQPVIDGLIVAYFGSLDEPFDVAKLFVIPWQAKAESDAAEKSVSQSLTAPFLVTPGTPGRTKPNHIAIFLALAPDSAFRRAGGPRCDITFGSACRPASKKKGDIWLGYAQEGEEEGSRYCINIHGHCARNYPVLLGLERQFDQLFSRMLGRVELSLWKSPRKWRMQWISSRCIKLCIFLFNGS